MIIILGTSIYILTQTPQNENIEDSERNQAELIWFIIALILSLSLFILMIIFNFHEYILITSNIIGIITTALAWDFSSRNSQETTRQIFAILTIVQIFLLQANRTAQSIGSLTSSPNVHLSEQ